ncbi:MAG: hypothetical protein RBS77_05090 [Candidatus Moranbacteria bacterium]|nr:hypothetical protein [Candidatus Moranbacteria bacterium]
MDRDRAINKVLRDLKMGGWVHEDDAGHVRYFLNALFVAGMEEQRHLQGMNNNCQKRVVVLNRHKEKIDECSSVLEASQKYKLFETSVTRLLTNKKLSRKGYYFKYADDENTLRGQVDQGGDRE